MRALALGHLKHRVGGHVQELRVWVDEVLDQPGAGDPVGLRAFARNPLHLVLLSSVCYAGSLPASKARLRYSYRPSNNGPESASSSSSSRTIDSPRRSTSRPWASGASK